MSKTLVNLYEAFGACGYALCSLGQLNGRVYQRLGLKATFVNIVIYLKNESLWLFGCDECLQSFYLMMMTDD